MGWPVVIATNGYGIPVTESDSDFAIPAEIADNGYGTPVVLVDSGGTPVKGVGGGVSYSAEAEALFARAAQQPSAGDKAAIDTALVAMDAAGLLAKFDAFWCLGAEDSAFADLNWLQDLYNLVPTGTLTFAEYEGYKGDGSTGYLPFNANQNGLTKFVQDSAHLMVWVAELPTISSDAEIGIYSGTDRARLRATNGTVPAFRLNQSVTTAASSVTRGLGMLVVSRLSSTDVKLYHNDTEVDAFSQASAALTTSPMALLRSISTYSNARILAASIGSGLTEQNKSDLFSIMLDLFMALGLDTNAIPGPYVTLPDAADSATGKGPTCTGLTRAPDGTFWVSNHGQALIGDPFTASICQYSADFTSLLDEIFIDGDLGITPTNMSMQGVTWDTSDDTLWIVLANGSSSEIVHVDPVGKTALSRTVVATDTNGIAYDAVRDCLWVQVTGAASGTLSRRAKAAPATVLGSATVIAIGSTDHIQVTGNRLIMTSGATATTGRVNVYDISTDTPALLDGVDLPVSQAIEGVYHDGDYTMWVTDDAYFHVVGPNLNRVLTHYWKLP